jgi:hypothetical protein
MKRINWFRLAAIWLICSYFNYGMLLGGFTYRAPTHDVLMASVVFSAGGPFTVPAALIFGGHWRTRPLTVEERWKAFHARWPNIDRADFE